MWSSTIGSHFQRRLALPVVRSNAQARSRSTASKTPVSLIVLHSIVVAYVLAHTRKDYYTHILEQTKLISGLLMCVCAVCVCVCMHARVGVSLCVCMPLCMFVHTCMTPLNASAYFEEHLLLLLLMPVSFRQVNDVTDSTSEVNQCISRVTLEHRFIAATKSVTAQKPVKAW